MLESLQRSGETPSALTNRPELDPALVLYWESFWMLSSDRSIGMAVGPIPSVSILTYAEKALGIFGLEPKHRFLRIIRALDSKYLEKTRKD